MVGFAGATVALASRVPGAVEAAPEVVSGELGARLDAYLEGAARYGFSGQVLVARDGAVVLHRAYGWSDPRGGSPLTVDAPLGVASMSKRFAAVALLRLAADRRLSLDTPIGDLLPAVPADKRAATLRQILAHTAGLDGGFEDDFLAGSRDESLARLLERPLVAPIGARWRYSTEGYNLVAAAIDAVAGEPYESYAARAVFRPLGLASTGFQSAPPAGAPEVAPARVGDRVNGAPCDWPRNWRIRGGGDVVSTAWDVYRAHVGLASGEALPAPIGRATLEPQAEIEPGVAYGFGTLLSRDERGPLIEWAGDTELGYNGLLVEIPDRRVVAVVLAPARDAYGRSLRQLVQAEVMAIACGEEVPPYPPGDAMPATERGRRIGSYALFDGALDLRWDGAQLWLSPRGARATAALEAALGLEVPGPEAEAATIRLLTGLRARDESALAAALGTEGAPYLESYLGEWRELVSRQGVFRRFEIVGATTRRDRVQVVARLDLGGAPRTMSFTWADGGRGRLVGTNPRAAEAPLLLAAVASPEGALRACEAWRVRCVDLQWTGDGGLAYAAPDGRAWRSSPRDLAGWSAPADVAAASR
jgi:CubicO group peptidase (beta-lactamase class C family)